MDLKIFANTVEQEVYDQINKLMSVDVFKDAKVRIMPDTHAGKGCVIGFTANLGDRVVPNLVGVDIGCSVYCVNLGKIQLSESDLINLDNFIRDNIPSGLNVNDDAHTIGYSKLKELRMYNHLRNVDHLHRSICSLGGGNHYLELDKDSFGNIYLCIHSGSRNLGQQVCRYYQKMAVDDCNGKYAKKHEIELLIAEYKKDSQHKKIQEAIRELREKHSNIEKVNEELCYLEGSHRDDYLYDMRICQDFARKNCEEIARRILSFLRVESIEAFRTVHNYIDFEDNIIRKGAIRCNKGEKVIIPLNMKDGSIIGIGKGNEDWNCSGPHGAGRLMSRSKARKSISIDDFKRAMNGIFTTSVNESTIDESPMAYKDASEIIELIKDTVDIVEVIHPIYNFKSSM